MSLADHVRTLGRGSGRARSLTREEARDAMVCMISDEAAPEAVGALLMLLRMKGETAEEICGFSEAVQASLPDIGAVDLDWPSYAAGRTRGLPWFLASAQLVAQAGKRVLLHGWNGTDPKVRIGLGEIGIGVAETTEDAQHLLDRHRIAYLPLEILSPQLMRLLRLREVLGLRSIMNTVCRMLNPGQANASVQGVFHPSYRLLQADAAQLLGWRNLSVIKGGGGEFERNPTKDTAVFGLRHGRAWTATLPSASKEARRMRTLGQVSMTDLLSGTRTSEFETKTVVGTSALALATLGVADSARAAAELWEDRTIPRAA
ncbi:MAG: glycosyl transferase family protein [Pseudomonadota bacterium]